MRIEYDFNFALRTTRGYMRTSLTPSLSPSLAFTWKERYLSSACSRAAARPEAWLCMLWSASRVSTWMDRYGDCQEQSVAIRRNPSQSDAPPRGLSTWMVQSSVEETAAKDRGWRRKKSSSPKMPPLTCMHPSNPRHCWCTQVQSVAISFNQFQSISCNQLQSVAISPPDDRIAHIAHEAGAQDAIAQIHLLCAMDAIAQIHLL